MGCGGNGACTVSSTFIAGGNAPSGCLSCGGAGTSGALSGCACKHKHPSKPAEIQFSGGDGATPPGNRVPANFVTVPPPKKDAKRPDVPFVPGANKADVPSSQNNGGIGRFAPPIPPPARQSNGKAPIPSRVFDVPSDLPIAMPPPKDSAAPVPFLPSVPMIGLAQDPNPFAPYCGPDNELTPASALCRAAGDAGLSDYCRQQLLAFLKSGSSQTLGSWIAAQELCDQAALRRAVGIAEASIAAKTSAGLYRASGGVYSPHAFVVYGMPHGGTVYVDDRPVMGRWLDAGLTRWEVPLPDANPHRMFVYNADRSEARGQDVLNGSTLVWSQMPALSGRIDIEGFGVPTRQVNYDPNPATQLDKPGFGNPFGVDGYAWKQDRVRKPSPFSYRGDGSTMDWRNPSGGMPNYHRPSGLGEINDEFYSDEIDMTTPEWIAAHPDTGTAEALRRQGALSETERNAAFARGRDNPPTDYGRIIGSVSQAVGGVFAGINQAVEQAENRRIRELEVNYANNARGRELALRERGQELAGEIARLRAAPSAATDPAMATLIQRLEQQGAEYRSAIQRLETEKQGMGGGTIAAIAIGSVAVLGLGAYALMGGGRRR